MLPHQPCDLMQSRKNVNNQTEPREALTTCINGTLMGPGTSSTNHLTGLDPPEHAAEALVATQSNAHPIPHRTRQRQTSARSRRARTRCAAAACAAAATWSARRPVRAPVRAAAPLEAPAAAPIGLPGTQTSSQQVSTGPWIGRVRLKDGFERRLHTVFGARRVPIDRLEALAG